MWYYALYFFSNEMMKWVSRMQTYTYYITNIALFSTELV